VSHRDVTALWSEIRRLYQETLKEEPALSEQGEAKVAVVLFTEGQIVPRVGHGAAFYRIEC
jgi:hypothetical protein